MDDAELLADKLLDDGHQLVLADVERRCANVLVCRLLGVVQDGGDGFADVGFSAGLELLVA